MSLSPTFAMAGDEYQLGPRTYDKSTTMHVSLFERLSKTGVYADHPQARRNINRTNPHKPTLKAPFVNLIRNYRSHSAILAVPSSLFYGNTLIPEAGQVDSLRSWSCWRGRLWPVLFACNAGIDACEDIRGPGGGWYNLREATTALAYAQNILAQGLITFQSDICIMSPFPAQVNRLRQLARHMGLRHVNIGPMEALQGLEHRFVISCTTRARKRFLEEDNLRGIGIVNESKKFNVALTRAKEGLVVIGNPWVLGTDSCWTAFMTFCWRNSLWQEDNAGAAVQLDSPELDVNAWHPDDSDNSANGFVYDPSGLEAALLYKERDKDGGSSVSAKFMRGNETQEEALWRSGVEAEEEIGYP